MNRVVLAILLVLLSRPAFASGGGIAIPWTVDPYGGSPAEQDGFYNGRTGIILNRAPWARLFAAWRMLHGLPVGEAAGKALAVPCCGVPDSAEPSIAAWTKARSAIPGVTEIKDYTIDVFRGVGDFASVQTCFPNAFDTAIRTLSARIATHGLADRWVRAWVIGQDAVFAGCSHDAALPALDPDAPAWLAADHAYQDAALALYRRDFGTAEQRFLAIAADASSPWQLLAPYLAARSAVTAALPSKDPTAFARARQRLAALAPADAYGHADLAALSGALAFRDQPDTRRVALASTLTAPALSANVAADFKDSRRLGQAPAEEPAYLDWIAVFGRVPDKPEASWFDHYPADQVWQTDADALAHARARWAATGDPAWLIAAMAWSAPGPDAADLVAASRSISFEHPAYLTALYHRIRLRLHPGVPPSPPDKAFLADAASIRAELDATLARADLALTDRNLLLAERAMVAADLADLVRLGPRQSPCTSADGTDKGCLANAYGLETMPYSPLRPDVRFGEETASIIDRLPLPQRFRLSDTAGLPVPLRLDLALTSWVRAVLTLDYAVADRLTPTLQKLLPQMTAEWATFLAARPGDDKRFAAWFILAKMPGADVDLLGGYVRPQGAVADFDGHWRDWVYARAGALPVQPPEVTGDLICYGLCGPGIFPFRLPAFAAALVDRTALERGRFLPANPKQAGSVWEDVLAYAKAYPADPRSPEALYWLVRVSRFGTGHNRSSYRAWVLLHNVYARSVWAQESKYFYD